MNLEKSQYIVISRRKKKPPDIPIISINNHILASVTETLFLGVTLTNNLSWKKHINTVVNNLHKHRSVLFLTKNYLSRNAMITLYYSLIYPVILYGNIIWGHSNQITLRPLELVQKSIVRTIMNRPRYFPTDNDFIHLKLLKISDINLFSGFVFT